MPKKNWGFDLKNMDTRVRPQDDFYRYANGGWMKRSSIPKSESRWGSFMKLRKDTDLILHGILEELAKKRGKLSEEERQLRDFYRSGMDLATRNARGLAPLKPWQELIASIKTPRDLVRVIGRFERAGLGGPWGIMIDQDMRDSTRYLIHLHQSGLGLPDRDYYLKDDAESKRVRAAYIAYLKRMKQPVETIMRLETALAKISMSKEDLRNPKNLDNPHTSAALAALAREVDWPLYFKQIGIKPPKRLNVLQPKFLAATSRLLVEVPLEEWKQYLSWHLLADTATLLSSKMVRESFTFHAALTGQKKMKPLWRRALAAVNGNLGELLGRIYVEQHFSPAAMRKMDTLIDDLFAAYEERIKALDWMSAATKKKALGKLKKIRRKIGHPKRWKSYKGVVIRGDDFFGNVLRAVEHETMRQLRKLGKPIDRNEWLMYPQTVNAYYQPSMNEIAFPAAILQPPFFSTEFDDAINYGAIGSVIGHEITHAFDDEGSQYDADGNLKSWWTPEDRTRFEKKAKVVKEQFDRYKVADGVPVNGQLTLGENIADLGGASIAYDAYQRHLLRSGKIEKLGGFTPEQRFFLGFAIFERELSRPEFQKLVVLTDPHSPGQFRINGPASNLPEFYAAWGVKKGDKLYREPRDRAKIW
jgi:putative endopeptidase